MLSVIVPAYKQEGTITKDIKNIEQSLLASSQPFEIVVVVDGSPDKTLESASELESSRIKVFSYAVNKGKGYALRYGAARAVGDPIVFLDAGMEINPRGIGLLWEHLKWYEADIVIGSKRHPASKVSYPLQRRVTSFFYQLLIFLLFGLNVKDTQTGLKMFRREVLTNVLPRLLVKMYAIDIEILAVSRRLGFRRIYEAPVDVSYRFDDLTHAATLGHILRMIKDTLAVFYRLKIQHYYDDGNERKWIYDPDLKMKINIG